MPAPAPTRGLRRVPTRRGVELALLIFAMIVVLLYSAAVEAGMMRQVTGDVWVPVAILFVIFFAVHIAIRYLAPYADPVLLPTVALINGLGVAFLRRLDLAMAPPDKRIDLNPFSGMAIQQVQWTAAAAVGAVLLLVLIR